MRLELDPGTEANLRARARLRAQRAENELRFAEHPWPFLCEAVYTHNPFAGVGGTVDKYPGLDPEMHDPAPNCPCAEGGCLNYLHHLANVWHSSAGQRLVIPKSRRLITSWTIIALHVWLVRYREGQMVAFVSQKRGENEDEGSAELVKRARFIEDHYPAEVQPRKTVRTWCRTHYPHNNSTIVGIAQGANQLRQLTITAWFGDEFAFWEQGGETYAASIPTLEGGGRCTLVSTANPGFMKQLAFDEWHTSGSG